MMEMTPSSNADAFADADAYTVANACTDADVYTDADAHLAQSFFLILNGINKCFDTCLSMQIQEHVNEHNWSSG